MLSVVLAALQSIETELQLQALPPYGGSVHVCVFILCVCVCVGELETNDGYSQLSRAGRSLPLLLLPHISPDSANHLRATQSTPFNLI